MTTIDEARRLALALPETTEHDHHGMNSFRVRGKIFATVPDDDHLRIMVDEDAILAAVAESPNNCEAFYWGKRPACVVVTLPTASADMIRELVTDAWRRKAPKSLAREFGEP